MEEVRKKRKVLKCSLTKCEKQVQDILTDTSDQISDKKFEQTLKDFETKIERFNSVQEEYELLLEDDELEAEIKSVCEYKERVTDTSGEGYGQAEPSFS